MARYYRSDLGRNATVSNEITGYAASCFVYFGDSGGAARAAAYLRDCAWNTPSGTFPFEPGSPLAYFFDLGIVARGLFAAARATGDDSFRGLARDAALSLAFDFLGDGSFHPVIELPAKQPLAYEPRWSRSPGCYQLKAALAWREVGDERAEGLFEAALAQALATHEHFLACEPDREKLMDRLHAYCYFLEGLLAAADRPEPRAALESGIARVAALWREISPQFERSDVCAQLLRLRLIAHRAHNLALNESDARQEAERTASFQSFDSDPRLRGGFWFGRKGGALLPFMNPVSTAFAAQALALWEQHCSGRWNFSLEQLI